VSSKGGLSLLRQRNLTDMKNLIAVVALALSLVSLGFQARNAKPAPLFDKFLVPAQISDFDYRVMAANQRMIRESIVMQNGMGVPFVKKVADDHQKLIVWVFISPKDLPNGYDERKKALLNEAIEVAVGVGKEFDLSDEKRKDAVSVEFWTFDQLIKNTKKPYAEYVEGELLVH
jgi:hypothetical protein